MKARRPFSSVSPVALSASGVAGSGVLVPPSAPVDYFSQEPPQANLSPTLPPLTDTGDGDIIGMSGDKTVYTIKDDDINCVPLVSVKGFTPEENRRIQTQHQELLRHAQTENGCKEVAFVFREGLEDCEVVLGSEEEIAFGPSLTRMGNNLFIMHNHPNNRGFSTKDIKFFIDSDQVRTFSIVKNSGEVEVIVKADDFDKQEMKNLYTRMIRKIVKTGTDKEYDRAVEKILEKGAFLWLKLG